MKRRWNLSVWAGFLVVVAGFVSYVTVFVRFPATRDVPWATLLIFAAGLALIVRGWARARRAPDLYRGRIAGPVLLVFGAALVAFFCFGMFYQARQIPPSGGAPRVGQKAPDFTLPDQDGNLVTLSGLLDSGADGSGGSAGVVLIFFRGHW